MTHDTSVSYFHHMKRVLTWLQMLGTTGAVANARVLLDEREREKWIVDALLVRMTVTEPQAAAA
jgi:hypothetical protein